MVSVSGYLTGVAKAEHSGWTASAHGMHQAWRGPWTQNRLTKTVTALPCMELTVQWRRKALNNCHANGIHCKYGKCQQGLIQVLENLTETGRLSENDMWHGTGGWGVLATKRRVWDTEEKPEARKELIQVPLGGEQNPKLKLQEVSSGDWSDTNSPKITTNMTKANKTISTRPISREPHYYLVHHVSKRPYSFLPKTDNQKPEDEPR